MRNWMPGLLVLTAVQTGCYSGVTGQGEDPDPSTESGTEPSSDDGDSDAMESTGAEDEDETDGDTEPDPEPGCEPGVVDVGASNIQRLTRVEYDNAVRMLLGEAAPIDSARLVLTDGHIGPFANNANTPVARETVTEYQTLAEELSSWATDRLDELVTCDITDPTCAEEFVEDFGRRAYRRPLEEDERARLLGVYDLGAEDSVEDGYRLVIETLLQSPNFLYRVEVGVGEGDVVALTSLEMASRLSFLLWKTAPDEALLAAAEAGELDDVEGVELHAQRLLDDERAIGALVSFQREWLGLAALETLEKDPVFEAFDAELWDEMQEESRRFTADVLGDGDGRLATLLTSNETFVTPRLAELYGVSSDGPGWTRVELDPEQRAGLLTSGAFLAATAHPEQTSPVVRGAAVRERMLCTELPAPPPDVADTPPEVDPTQPTRDRFDEHRSNPACAGCHSLMDPIGYGFENYDPIGRWRTMDGGFEVDASGELLSTTDADGEFDGAIELIGRLANSNDVRACAQTQMFRSAAGREPRAEDVCAEAEIYERFASSDFDIRELALAIATSDAFRHRRIATEDIDHE